MKKIIGNVTVWAGMFLLAVIMTFLACRQSKQASLATGLPLVFTGEYSQNGGPWQKLDRETDLSGFEGDLVLRGSFDIDLPGGAEICSYLDHIGMSVYADGQLVYESSCEEYPDMCGKMWIAWDVPEENSGGEIEIRLFNPHRYGNPDAYREFLDSMFFGRTQILKNDLEKDSLPFLIAGIFVIVFSIALIGTAIGYLLLKLPDSILLLKLGVLSIMMGVYILIDTRDISLRINQTVFHTYVCQLSILLAAWILGICITHLLKDKRKQIGKTVMYVLTATDFVLMGSVLCGAIKLYDTGACWAVVQGTVSLFLLILCILEIKTAKKKERILMVSGGFLLAVLLLELWNGRRGWWETGIVVKVTFLVIFVLQLGWAVMSVSRNYQNAMKMKKMKEEIRNSRIVLSMSQIKIHFIFNILNAICGMCEYDPQKADETLVMFSRYLRHYIHIMDKDELESLSKSMEYLEDYIQLEQIRFGNKIKFVKILEEEEFMLPPLILQPIVENAIRHGLLPKKHGGTIALHTWKEEDSHIIEIADDGAGFDVNSIREEDSIGMKNVRFRLQYMVNGTMETKSTPGEGTTVTIRIPCAGKMKTER